MAQLSGTCPRDNLLALDNLDICLPSGFSVPVAVEQHRTRGEGSLEEAQVAFCGVDTKVSTDTFVQWLRLYASGLISAGAGWTHTNANQHIHVPRDSTCAPEMSPYLSPMPAIG